MEVGTKVKFLETAKPFVKEVSYIDVDQIYTVLEIDEHGLARLEKDEPPEWFDLIHLVEVESNA